MDFDYLDLSLVPEGRGVGGIDSTGGVKVTSLLGDAKNKKVLFCNGQCHCCADTSECIDLRERYEA